MLNRVSDNLWVATHSFKIIGMPLSTTMTVVRLHTGELWVHSAIPPTPELICQIQALGEVSAIVAPNCFHHLFVSDFRSHFPKAKLYLAPGLAQKRPDLGLAQVLDGQSQPWAGELDYLIFPGLAKLGETLWWHRPSQTLIVTDLLQIWQGKLEWQAELFSRAMGVYQRLAMPRSIRYSLQDKAAAVACAQQIMAQPCQHMILGHNAVLTQHIAEQLQQAFRFLTK